MILGLKILSENLSQKNLKQTETSKIYTVKQIEENLISNYNKMKSIKEQVEDIKSQWKSFQEDISCFNFAKNIYEGNSIKESFQKAINDLKLEYEDAKNSYNFYKDLKNKYLIEAETISPVVTSDYDYIEVPNQDNLNNPYETNKNDSSKQTYEYVLEELSNMINEETTENILQYLFDELVPDSGKADTFAGELIRAIMDLIYNYKQNKYLFFEGDGLNRCGGSAQYLIDHGYEDEFAFIIEDINSINEDEYEKVLFSIANKIIQDINENTHYINEKNNIDSRHYNYDEIKLISPIYEYVIKIPDKIQKLYNNNFNIYNILRFIKDTLDNENIQCTVKDIYNPKANTIQILNIDKNTMEQLEGIFEISNFWDDYYNTLVEDLEENLQIIYNQLNENTNNDLVNIFMQYHEDPENYEDNPFGYSQVYDILDQYGDEDEDVDILFLRATEDEQRKMIDLIRPKNEYLN